MFTHLVDNEPTSHQVSREIGLHPPDQKKYESFIRDRALLNFRNSNSFRDSSSMFERILFSRLLDMAGKIEEKLNEMYPDKEYKTIPHSQTLSGQGSVFIAKDNGGNCIYIKINPSLLPTDRMLDERRSVLPFLKDSFNFQISGVERVYGDEVSNANATISSIMIGGADKPNVIVLKQVLGIGIFSFKELGLEEVDSQKLMQNSTLEFLGVLEYFLERHKEKGTLPRNWGLVDLGDVEFKGVRFFIEDLLKNRLKLGIYDVGEETLDLSISHKRNFLRNIGGFVLALTGGMKLANSVTLIENGQSSLHLSKDYNEE